MYYIFIMFTTSANSFDELYRLLVLRKVPFLIVFFVVTFLSYSVLYAIDFIPEPIEATNNDSKSAQIEPIIPVVVTPAKPKPAEVPVAVVNANATQPIKIIFDSLDGKQVNVLNPTQVALAILTPRK